MEFNESMISYSAFSQTVSTTRKIFPLKKFRVTPF